MKLIAFCALTLATFALAQEPESRPASRVQISEAGLEHLRKAFGPPFLSASPPACRQVPEAEAMLEATRLDALKLYDAAIDSIMARMSKPGAVADARILRPLADAIADSDALVLKVETPDFEARCPERDLIGQSERPLWGHSQGAKHTASPRSILVEGVPLEGRKVVGVVSALPPRSAPWRDIVIDLEFTLLSGEMEMYVRYWPDRKSYQIRFAPSEGYELNKAYRMTVRVKGSQISLKQPDQPENSDRLRADVSRTGGIGFGLKPGSMAEISRFNLKVLR
jgi:hypothetical protein